jgi:DNA-binding GntR family transcriptional regulator
MKPIDRTLSWQAYEAVEKLIVTGRLVPDTTYTEAGIAEMAGFGRTPVREALQRLASEGLVQIRPRAGVEILEMDHARQLQLLEARSVLQEQTVRLAARRATVEQRARMLQLAQAVEDAALIGDAELYLHIARDIHQILREASGNEFLERFMSSLYILSRRFSFTHRRLLNAPNITRAASTHAGILRAVAARDEAEAARASGQMMEFLREFTLSSRATTTKPGNETTQTSGTAQAAAGPAFSERPLRAGGARR